jgi:hypothetical protein
MASVVDELIEAVARTAQTANAQSIYADALRAVAGHPGYSRDWHCR